MNVTNVGGGTLVIDADKDPQRIEPPTAEERAYVEALYDSGIAFVADPGSHKTAMTVPAAYKIEVDEEGAAEIAGAAVGHAHSAEHDLGIRSWT